MSHPDPRQDTKIKVFFKQCRNFNETIAVFPEVIFDSVGSIQVYTHAGQHHGAHPDFLKDCKAAAPEQYKDLLEELNAIYDNNLEVI